MTQKECKEIIRLLRDIYPDSHINKTEGFVKEYYSYLLKLDYDRAMETVEILKIIHKEIPIAEFHERYVNSGVRIRFSCPKCGKLRFVTNKK